MIIIVILHFEQDSTDQIFDSSYKINFLFLKFRIERTKNWPMDALITISHYNWLSQSNLRTSRSE